ncbi:MAG: U32 family peptidase C-terminal domain-containing protein [Desulfopila sp.]|jgi:putative protease|nr:U32 family peptidase C-terminal domain-containing protein [Desulfopila sp.]
MMKNESCKGSTVLKQLPELLAPAGNLEKLITAVHYGADAVYFGGKDLSLRAKAGNFSSSDMVKGIEYAHVHGKKVYVTVNILAHNADLNGLEEYFAEMDQLGVDAFIIADPGILKIARLTAPEIPIHLSTQANVTNHAAAAFWLDQGVSRLNLARELSLEEICAIRERVSGELEVFVHGALCISYSGRCMLSNYLTARDANRGNCSHPCRFSYHLVEEKRPGEMFPVEEDERGTYIFNSKDLCLLKVLPGLVAAGVDSLKIEGRMKSIFYVGGVVRVYRAALDYLGSLPESAWQNPEEIVFPEEFYREISKTGTRGITENFIRRKPDENDMLYYSSRAEQAVEPVAVIRESGERVLVEIRNRLQVGEKLEYMGRGMSLQNVEVVSMITPLEEDISFANPGNLVYLQTEPVLSQGEPHGILRREK